MKRRCTECDYKLIKLPNILEEHNLYFCENCNRTFPVPVMRVYKE